MRTPEETARESLGNIVGPLRHIYRDSGWLDALDVLIAQEAEHLAGLIRARDAEGAEASRAETLAEFTEERTDRMIARRVPCDCPNDWQHHARVVWDDSPATHVRHDIVPSRRLVGPWEPDANPTGGETDA